MRAMSYMADLQSFVLLSKISGYFLKLVLHSCDTVQFGPLGVLLLLELVTPFLGFLVIAFGALHVR